MKWILISAALLFAGHAKAQGISADGQARVVSLLSFIQTECGKYHRLDRQIIDDYAVASAKIGIDLIGGPAFGNILKKELSRRQKEIRATGPAMWCSYQRPNLNELGLKAFLD